MASARSAPYGIMINSKGVPFFVEFGANKVASIDPPTTVIREWTLPNAGSRPRRIAIDAQDNVWYSDYSRGFRGRFHRAVEWFAMSASRQSRARASSPLPLPLYFC